MKTVLKIMAFGWLVFCLFIGIRSLQETPSTIQREKQFVTDTISPAFAFILYFRNENLRLPTKREFYSWEREFFKDYTVNLSQPVDSLITGYLRYNRNCNIIPEYYHEDCKNIDWSKHFTISFFNGDYEAFYFSWRDIYKTNSYSWDDGYSE